MTDKQRQPVGNVIRKRDRQMERTKRIQIMVYQLRFEAAAPFLPLSEVINFVGV